MSALNRYLISFRRFRAQFGDAKIESLTKISLELSSAFSAKFTLIAILSAESLATRDGARSLVFIVLSPRTTLAPLQFLKQ